MIASYHTLPTMTHPNIHPSFRAVIITVACVVRSCHVLDFLNRLPYLVVLVGSLTTARAAEHFTSFSIPQSPFTAVIIKFLVFFLKVSVDQFVFCVFSLICVFSCRSSPHGARSRGGKSIKATFNITFRFSLTLNKDIVFFNAPRTTTIYKVKSVNKSANFRWKTLKH